MATTVHTNVTETLAYINTTVNETVHCEMFLDEPSKCDALVLVKRVVCSISMLGSLSTLAIIVLFKKYREFTQRLIGNLSFAALLYAISFVISDFSSSSRGLCVFQAAFMTYIGWVILLVSMTILLGLYCVIVEQKDIRTYEKYLLAICWILPTLFAGLPFLDQVYGPAGVWCWLENKWGWRFGIWYIWKGISDVIFFIAIIKIWFKLLRKSEERSQEITTAHKFEIYEDFKTLRLYPVVYFLIFILPTVNRIYNAVKNNPGQKGYSFALVLLHSLTSPLFGAVVALTFVLDVRTRNTLRQKGVLDEIVKKWRRSGHVHEYQLRGGSTNRSQK